MYYTTFMKNRFPQKYLGPLEVAAPQTDMFKEPSCLRPFCQPVHCSNLAAKARLVGFTTTWGSYKVMLPNRRLAISKDPTPWQPILSIPVQVRIDAPPAIEGTAVRKTEQTRPQTPQTSTSAMPGTFPRPMKNLTPAPPAITPPAPPPNTPAPLPPSTPPMQPEVKLQRPESPWRAYADTWPEALRCGVNGKQVTNFASRSSIKPTNTTARSSIDQPAN